MQFPGRHFWDCSTPSLTPAPTHTPRFILSPAQLPPFQNSDTQKSSLGDITSHKESGGGKPSFIFLLCSCPIPELSKAGTHREGRVGGIDSLQGQGQHQGWPTTWACRAVCLLSWFVLFLAFFFSLLSSDSILL